MWRDGCSASQLLVSAQLQQLVRVVAHTMVEPCLIACSLYMHASVKCRTVLVSANMCSRVAPVLQQCLCSANTRSWCRAVAVVRVISRHREMDLTPLV